MGRLRLGLIASLLTPSLAGAIEIGAGHNVEIGFEAGYLYASGHPSWTEGFVGKLRYEDDGLVFNRAYLDYRGQLTDTLNARLVLEAYDDNVGNAIDYTQAFLEWRPIPKSANRYRVKFGTFYPRISLENTDPGWSSPYTLNSSAINTWVAEELRATGVEFSVSRRISSTHTISLQTSVFIGNDPAGSLLAWRGWAVHDRQTRPSDDLPLPPLPQIQPGRTFEAQDPYVEPLQELDNEAGFYVSGEWRMNKRLLLRVMHFNNNADPTVLKNGQYGWETIFNHIGLQATLPGDIGLLAQWLSGSTVMGPFMGERRAVDVEYRSRYLLLTRAFDKHRISARYDHFVVTQNDNLPEDNNSENGYAWTVNYQYAFNDHATLAFEWLSIKTHRGAWVYYGLSPTATERQTQVALRIRF